MFYLLTSTVEQRKHDIPCDENNNRIGGYGDDERRGKGGSVCVVVKEAYTSVVWGIHNGAKSVQG